VIAFNIISWTDTDNKVLANYFWYEGQNIKLSKVDFDWIRNKSSSCKLYLKLFLLIGGGGGVTFTENVFT